MSTILKRMLVIFRILMNKWIVSDDYVTYISIKFPILMIVKDCFEILYVHMELSL